MAVRYGLLVVGLRVEFYKRSAKNPMHARLVMPVLEGQNGTPATDDLDDVMKKFDMHMATQLIKAAASQHATNAVKVAGTTETPSSSHERPEASTMVRDATASRFVEAARDVGVLVPSRSVRDSGAALHPFQQRRSHEPDSSDPGGPRVWARGSSGWMPERHIRRGDDRRGREDTQYRCHDIVKLCCMARRTGGKERALCGKPIEAIVMRC
jgi:hypothetical protein